MNIGSGCPYPANALSNFSPHPFVLDNIAIASMEGFLQSLKFDKLHIQVEVCKLVGKAAKYRGKKRNKAWKTKQTLWWNGKAYLRDSEEYHLLLVRAYRAMFDQSESFRRALVASNNAVFVHTLGSNKEEETVLTEREFCGILTSMRLLL
jgi:hypothetical protein